MPILAHTVDHLHQGLDAVERLTPQADGAAQRIYDIDGVDGVIVLATCNRVEVYADVRPDLTSHMAHALEHIIGADMRLARVLVDDEVYEHTFRLASGLESQVVGEREITGQMRRALARARSAQITSSRLTSTFEAAVRTSKRVERETGLAGRGRSIVAVGLDMIERQTPLRGGTAVIVGTGNYAGAVTAALKERDLARVMVHSQTGRGEYFARMHRLEVADQMSTALAEADLVVTCRGFGRPAIPVDDVRHALARRQNSRDLAILDLAVTHDVDPGVASLDGVHVIDLNAIHHAVPAADQEKVEAAEAIVAEELASYSQEQMVRGLGQDIHHLYAWAERHIDAEMQRLPEEPDHEAVHAALRRLSNALVHLPTTMLREAAREGRAEAMVRDLHEVIDEAPHE